MKSSARVRPRLHFTARQGWTNDPHGIVHVDGRYHMFFQYNPGGLSWSPNCHWGHAISDDLITWDEVDVALYPARGEVGCWSGSVVIDDRGPVIVYTRIVPGDWGRGQVALARPRNGMSDWIRDPSRSVIDGPPGDLDIVAFRDPHVRREGDEWKAVLGAGFVGVGGCALQYSSHDLQEWTFDGVLAVRAASEPGPVRTGTVWECPQLLQVGDDWVMLMSAWEDHVLHNVNYAIGDYDGKATFTASRYGRFTHGRELYATTTFRDVDGRLCAMSWLRERGNLAPENAAWCSAMSLPHVLSIVDGRLAVSQHPSLEGVLAWIDEIGDAVPGGYLDAGVSGHVWRLRFGVSGDHSAGFRVSVHGDGPSFAVEAAGALLAVVDGDGAILLKMPVTSWVAAEVDMVVDADIVEITVSGTQGIASTRVPVVNGGDIRISAAEGASITRARLSMPLYPSDAD